MRCVWIAFVVAACGEGDASPDAAPDAGPPPDAVQCSLAPVPPVTLAWSGVEVEFDQLIGSFPDPIAIFIEDTELAVFTSRTVHRVGFDGTVASTSPIFVAPEPYMTEVVSGIGGYGAYVGRGTGQLDLCILAANGIEDPARCTPVSYGVLVAEDGLFHIYAGEAGRIERRTYSADAELSAMISMTVPGTDRPGIFAGAATPTGTVLLGLVGISECPRVREYFVEPDAEVRVRELLTADANARYVGWEDASIGANDTGASILVSAGCLVDGCDTIVDGRPILSVYEDGALVSDAVTPALPQSWEEGDYWTTHGYPRVVMRDGTRTIVVAGRRDCNYEGGRSCYRCSASLEVSRLDANGAADGPTLDLPTEHMDEQIAFAAAVIGPDDYAVAYTATDGLRLMRVRLP